MTAIVQRAFGGMIPKLSRAHLPELNAQKAVNCYLVGGELKAFNYADPLFKIADSKIFGGTPKAWKVFQFTDKNGHTTYQAFDDKNAKFVRGPLANDKYGRYYWTAESVQKSGPRQSQLWYARWDGSVAEGVPKLAGLPKPPEFTCEGPPSPDHTVLDETRVYVITWITDLGEESQPSEPVTSVGYPYYPWDLKNLPLLAPDNTGVIGIRIYRTITGTSGVAAYYFVDEVIGFTSGTYRDKFPIRDVALNDTLTTFMWNPPPDNMRGLLAHPNGFLVGYNGYDVYFSEPYRPHAWPASYVLTVKDKIIGLGLLGNTVMVLTDMYPYACSGINPASMTLTKVKQAEPCVSEGGIVSTVFGVYYPSPNGLMLVTPGQVSNVTDKLLTRNLWQDYIDNHMSAGVYGTMYVGFTNEFKGFVFSPSEPISQFSELDKAWTVDTMQSDAVADRLTLLRDNKLYEWNPKYGYPVPYSWKSKEFIVPKPMNLGAIRLYFDDTFADNTLPADIMQAYNIERVAWKPPLAHVGDKQMDGWLAPLASMPMGGSQSDRPAIGTSPLIPRQVQLEHYNDVPQIRASIGASSLYDMLHRRRDMSMMVLTLWAGCVTEPVFVQEIVTNEMIRLPSGYKEDRWCFMVEGNLELQMVKIAETGKELMRV